eukprot:COSAG05_NODE_1074_length_5958_cov_5.368152_4_plen_40_part_00
MQVSMTTMTRWRLRRQVAAKAELEAMVVAVLGLADSVCI